MALEDPDQSVIELATRVDLSVHTVQQRLKEQGLRKWQKARVPALRPADARARLRWCNAHKNWIVEQWNKVVWSDECSVARGKTGRQEWVFRPAKDKWKPYAVQTDWAGRDKVSQMF